MSKWTKITAIILAVVLIAVTFSDGILNISLKQGKLSAQTGTGGMAYTQVNKSGCVVRKGNCQIRLDFYLEPEDPRYADRYLYLVDTTSPEYLAGYSGKVDEFGNPIDQEDYDLWWESLPRAWINTPFHTHFIYLSANFTEEDIKAQIDIHIGNFYQAFQDRWDEVQGGMRHGWATETRINPIDYSKVETPAEYDARVAACQDAIDTLTPFVYEPKGDGEGKTFPATEIDMGSAAIARVSTHLPGYTLIDKANPANDTGTIDTFELWVNLTMSGTTKVGTFYGSGSSYTNRDGQAIGTVTSGAKRTFSGLSIDVTSGDFTGTYYSIGKIERTTSGGVYLYRKSGDQFGTGTQTYPDSYPDTPISLYGTGETVGCSPSISLNTSSWSVNSGNPVATSSNYATGLTYFEITNNSGGAVTITIGGTDMTGGGYTWDLDDGGSPGDVIYALKAGLEGGDYTIIVRETATFNTLKAGLADSGTQGFGLKLWTPTNFDDGNAKSGTTILTTVCD